MSSTGFTTIRREYVCYAYILGAIDIDVAAPFIQLSNETFTYNRITGRNLNTRHDDASDIYKCPDHAEYTARSTREGGMPAVDTFNTQRRMPVYQLHNTLPAADLLLKAMPWMKMVHINRHPIDQSYKWFERQWGVREINDPLSNVPIIDTPHGAVPWFAHGMAEQFIGLNPYERAVKSVLRLQAADDFGYDALDDEQKRQSIYRFPLEGLFTDPDRIVAEIGAFIGRVPRPEMAPMLIEENCPRNNVGSRRAEYTDAFRAHLAPDIMDELTAAADTYEARWL